MIINSKGYLLQFVNRKETFAIYEGKKVAYWEIYKLQVDELCH